LIGKIGMQLRFTFTTLSFMMLGMSCQPESGAPSSAPSIDRSTSIMSEQNSEQKLTSTGTVSIDVLAPCTVDGQVGCITTDQFKSADISNIDPETITLGTVIAGVYGKAIHARQLCSSRGQQNCVASGPFFVGPPCSSSEYGCYLPPAGPILQSFTTNTPIFVRANGNDQKGDGSVDQPFATPQRAFELAYKGTGDFVVDIGEGSFPEIDLKTLGATDWPSRIAIRGAGAGISKLAGINARGIDMTQTSESPSDGKNLSISSNSTINIGKIDARGGQVCCGAAVRAGHPGTIELFNVVTDDILIDGSRAANSNQQYSSDGGSLFASNSSLGHIFANGVTDNNDGQVSNGGIIKLASSAAGVIHANGGSRLAAGCGAHGGRVYLKDSTLEGAKLSGGSGHSGTGEMCDGQPGSVRGSRQ
jgi:hypothetical protein